MTDADEQWKLAELDRLLNDPDVPMQPSRIWALLAELSGQHKPAMPAQMAASESMRASMTASGQARSA